MQKPGITGRALLGGVLLSIVNVFWITGVEVRFYILDGTSLPLFITPLFLLLLLIGMNTIGRRFLPRLALTQVELLTIYLMMVVSSTFAGHDMLQNLFGQITHPYYFAPQNNWQDSFLRSLPPNLFISNADTLKAWYRGNTPPQYALGYWVHWAVPLALWGSFFLTLVFMCGCLVVLLRRAWTENEKLAFPIIQLPLAMTEPTGAFYRSPLMWLGFTVAFVIGVINGLHALYPNVPNLPFVKLYDVGQYFINPPWNAIRDHGMQTSLYPFAIGLAYFIPLDLAFSCWFSYLLARVWFVLGRSFGWDGPSAAQGWPFLKEISSGAWIGVAVAILYNNRHYLNRIVDAILEPGKSQEITSDELRRLRIAFVGFVGAFFAILAWCWFLLSLNPVTTIAFLGIFLALSLAITRVRAEFGTPHEIVFVKPADTLVTLLGTKTIGDKDLIGMQSLYWFNRGYRCHPIPNFLEGYKMAEGREMPFARLTAAYALAGVVAFVATVIANYLITFDAGAAGKATGYKQWVGQEAFGQLSSWITQGQKAGATNLYFFLGGLFSVTVFATLRNIFPWWSLHPAGFALGISYAMNYFWLCVLVAWLIKSLLMRYGGMKAHRQAIPFFLGLALGDYTVGAIWSLLALLLEQATYKIYI